MLGSLAARASLKHPRDSAGDSDIDGRDGVGDVAFEADRRCHGVGNRWEGDILPEKRVGYS